MSINDLYKEIPKKSMVTTMRHGNYSASLMKAQRLLGDNIHCLPMGSHLPVIPIGLLPGVPSHWNKDPGTYVCPVSTEWGLWFSFTDNDKHNTAILMSVKGLNPITGVPLNELKLEQYKDECPKHRIKFTHNRYCTECGYQWPPQNYLVGADGVMWWDGMREPDGTVRQFFFTDKDRRDIASTIMGEENTVPAFGFAFYSPKIPIITDIKSAIRYGQPIFDPSGSTTPSPYTESDEETEQSPYASPSPGDEDMINDNSTDNGLLYTSSDISYKVHNDTKQIHVMCCSFSNSNSLGLSVSSDNSTINPIMEQEVKTSGGIETRSRSVSVGAGAKIKQNLDPDKRSVEDWKPEPVAIIRLYFCFEEQLKQILDNGGVKELVNNTEGFLDGLPVG